MRAGDRAWIGLACGIMAYEVMALPEELLSEATDRWMLRHPWLVRLGALLVAGHVCNAWPERYDVLHWVFKVKYLVRHREERCADGRLHA